MKQANRLAMGQDWNATICSWFSDIDVRAGEIDFALTEDVGPAAPQAPTIIGMHCRHHLCAIPGFGAFQDVARICINVKTSATTGQQSGKKFSDHVVKLV